ncbi:hypothetical protein [Neolewinella antarctica]|uniref:Outer membrane protein beta-barrel domain-containing protein n=1 Tax=Neolewinella antarctica TaxID=442734 RepID=A0ABX0XHF8_9BACT|nr:hypothetical protein [Neolewinella antarctica]NJC28288.1 hypothetical protein [Neolewinella antarctica]
MPKLRFPIFAVLWLSFLALPNYTGTCVRAQGLAGAKNLDRAILFQVGYGLFNSAADLNDRFGNGFAFDGGVSYLPANSNWAFGVHANFGFGSDVKEDILADLRTSDGFLIGNQREPADVKLRQRQLFVGPSVGYTFRIGGNQRAGINLRTSLGYFAHRIRIQDDPVQTVAAIFEENRAGYDRLTGGPAIYQFFGYQHLSENRRINFYVGADLLAGFTKPSRAFDVPTGAALPDDRRTDVALGIRAGLIIPIYLGEGREIFYK